jgi:hypothetical protein
LFRELGRRNAQAIILDGAAAAREVDRDSDLGGLGVQRVLEELENNASK